MSMRSFWTPFWADATTTSGGATRPKSWAAATVCCVFMAKMTTSPSAKVMADGSCTTGMRCVTMRSDDSTVSPLSFRAS